MPWFVWIFTNRLPPTYPHFTSVMRSADGADAWGALSTACPNAAKGRAAAAPAMAQPARNFRRPLVVVMTRSLLELEDVHAPAFSRIRHRVHSSGRDECDFRRGRRSGEYHLDRVAHVTMHWNRGAGRQRPGHGAVVF